MDPLTMFSCPFRHDTTLQHHRLLSVTANVTRPRGSELLRTPLRRSSHSAHSQKFAKNNALNGRKFIGNSSPLASVDALYDLRRG